MIVEREFYTQEDLIRKLGIQDSRSRINTLRRKTYENKIPGQVQIFGRWHYRICEIENALISGKL